MVEPRFDVLVVGAGIMGACTAYELARRGKRVALLEQYALPHQRGSSHGASRIFRLAYDSSDYVALAQSALPLWHEAEAKMGTTLLSETGGLDLGPPSSLTPIATALRAGGAAFERISEGESRRRFPAYRLPPAWEALFQPEAAVIHADRAWNGFLQLATEAGVLIRESARVTSIRSGEHGVSVETNAGRLDAGQAVLTTAAWSKALIEPLGLHIPLIVTQEHVVYFRRPTNERVLPFICHPEVGHEPYGLPDGSNSEIKVGSHGSGPTIDADRPGPIDPMLIENIEWLARETLPSLQERSSVDTCLYTSTPDDDFVLDRIDHVIIAAGFSGHGFKFAPLIGRLLAEMVENDSGPPLARFAAHRFQRPHASAL